MAIYERPAELLQNLIRFDTTNPPGNEQACIAYIQEVLQAGGVEPKILAKDAARPNIVARLKGDGNAAPLLLYGHVDVVTTAGQIWQHPPFEAELVDGYIWGRGALDMKGGVAMMVAAFLRAKAEGVKLPGDVVLAVVSDEEAFGEYGAKFLVEHHAELFEGIRYAIGEFGGFSMHLGPTKVYPVMVSEKQLCGMKATFRGPAGHGALPLRGGAMAKLARFLQQVDEHTLPVHITPVTRQMFEAIGAALPEPMNAMVDQLLDPEQTDTVLEQLGETGRPFSPLFHNTVSPTMVKGSNKVNVIPAEVTLRLDGRLLPGFGPDDMVAELRALAGEKFELEVERYEPGSADPDMGLFDTLAGILREMDPEGTPVPLLMSGVTDARFLSRLGIQTYGFLPMNLPAEFNFTQTIHAADERVPVEALEFGTNAVYQALQRFER